MAKRLTRSRDKKIAGVCGGIGEHLNIDPTIIRLVWLVAVLVYGTGLIIYLLLWIVIPAPSNDS